MPRIGIVPLLLACCAVLHAKAHVAERYDVRVRILPDATLRVTESVQFHFSGGAYSWVSREIRKGGTDRVFDIEATMDGERARADIEESGYQIRVTWRFQALAETTHDFTLSYGVEGAVRKDPDRDVLEWRAIPDRHDYTILAGQIEVEYPEGAALVETPEATRATAARQEQGRSVFTLPELPADRGARVWVRFRPGFAQEAPRWQIAQQEKHERSRRAWAMGGAAGLIGLALGLFWLVGLRRSMPPNVAIPSEPDNAAAIESIPPAVAARLAGGGTSVQRQLGTLFDLARRGVVSIEKGAPRRFRKENYEIQPRDVSQALLPYERDVLELALAEPREFPVFLQRLAARAGWVHKRVEEHMISGGLLDPERLAARRRWQINSLLAMVGALAAVALGVATGKDGMEPGNAASVGIGAAAFVLGIVGMVMSAGISALTQSGALQAAPCRRMRGRLLEIARSRVAAAPDDFDRWLPLALAVGWGAVWAKRFRTAGVPMPPWFALEGDDYAFFDFVASTSAAADGSGGGGGDGGGGSGGGGSSAG